MSRNGILLLVLKLLKLANVSDGGGCGVENACFYYLFRDFSYAPLPRQRKAPLKNKARKKELKNFTCRCDSSLLSCGYSTLRPNPTLLHLNS